VQDRVRHVFDLAFIERLSFDGHNLPFGSTRDDELLVLAGLERYGY